MYTSKMFKTLLVILVSALFSTGVSAADGDLDTTFNTTGFNTTAVGVRDEGRAIAIQADGKIVLAGYSDFDFAVARYNTDGSLDTTFDTDGKVTTPIALGVDDRATSVAIQADGKIVVAGYYWNELNFDFVVVRYNPNGSLDTTFDTDGKVLTGVGISNDFGTAVAIQPNGKIVVAGYSQVGANYDFSVVRYNADGSLDTTFDTDGKVITPIGANNDYAYAVGIQTDGKIVVTGIAVVAGFDFTVVRYNTDGSLDITFDTDGKVTTPVGIGNDYATSMAIQTNGKIVAAGYARTGSDNDFAVVRYNTDGSLDTTFDTDGKVTTAVGTSNEFAYAVAVQSSEKIVVAGSSFGSSKYNFAAVRYNSNGSLDPTFDMDGKVTTPIGIIDDQSYTVAIQTNGKIVVGGTSDSKFAVARYQSGLAPTAAPAQISGQVKTASGNGIRNVIIQLTDANTGETRFTRTSSLGIYTFEDLPVGETYILSILSKRYNFSDAIRVISLNGDLTNVNFVSIED